MARLELDYNRNLWELEQTMEAFYQDWLAGATPGVLHLNYLTIDLPIAAAITHFLARTTKVVWKCLELEDCDGVALDALLPVLWNGPFRKIRFTPLASGDPDRLVDPSMLSLGVALRSNHHLQEVVLQRVVLGRIAVGWLLEGFEGHHEAAGVPQALQKLALWDCTLDEEAIPTLALALSKAVEVGLQDFGLVMSDLSEEELEIILHAFYDVERTTTKALQGLDLRCLSSGIEPVIQLLEHNSSLRTLDLSFQHGGDGLDVGLLCEGLRQAHSNLHTLHVCRNYISDAGLDLLLDAVRVSPSLRVLNLSLNQITSVHRLAEQLAANALPRLQKILLDGNPIEDPSPLVEALHTNIGLEECLIPQVFEEIQQELHFYTLLNRGGRRLVLVGDPHYHAPRIPMGLWPKVLERANRIDFDNYPNSTGRAEVLYCLLHGPVLFPV